MTDPIPLPTGAHVQLRVPGPPTIVMPAPVPPTVVMLPVRGLPGLPGEPGTPGDGASIIGETPSGTRDGVNTTFTIEHTPRPGSVAVYRNGLREHRGIGYTVDGTELAFTTAPLSSDAITVDYLMEG